MPHQCVRCGSVYADGASEILQGCSCGSKLFFFIKKETLDNIKTNKQADLTKEDRTRIEEDISHICEQKSIGDETVVLDFESVQVQQPGKYSLDLVQLFNNEPLVYKLEDGKYMVDLASTFERVRKQ